MLSTDVAYKSTTTKITTIIITIIRYGEQAAFQVFMNTRETLKFSVTF